MSNNAINWTIKITCSVFALIVAGALWYYTMGRKPHVLISAPVKVNESAGVALHAVGPNEVLLVAASKATLYDLEKKGERWSANLNAAPAATPVPKAAPKPAATPAPQENADPLAAARTKKHFAKLEKWAAELNDKRGKLKTKLQIEAFNEEAAKYHAELTAARAEAGVALPTPPRRAVEEDEEHGDDFPSNHPRIVALKGSIWIAQGQRIGGFDRADGHMLKNLPLAGHVSSIERGEDEIFVRAALANGRDVQYTRIAGGGATVQNFTVSMPPAPQEEEWIEGRPHAPSTPELQVLFSANRGSLLKLDVRLTERKLTERQVISGETNSDLEAWDKKSKGGVGDDALAMAQALNREAERDATGGKEIIDESTYQVTLSRPFAPTVAAATAQVHGHVEVFSTPTLDLITAGKDLVAFDHANKKLWQVQLAQPISPIARAHGSDDQAVEPCLDAGERLYFFDSAYLTAFASATGQPAWRLPLKNIHKVQLDDSGRLYVSTQPSGLGAIPQLLQVEAKSGRVIWKKEKYEGAYVSGKDLYVTRETRNAEDAVNSVFSPSKAPQCRWKLYKLSTRDGEAQWEWFQTRRPVQIEADHKRVSLLFADELQVLTSIAL